MDDSSGPEGDGALTQVPPSLSDKLNSAADLDSLLDSLVEQLLRADRSGEWFLPVCAHRKGCRATTFSGNKSCCRSPTFARPAWAGQVGSFSMGHTI